MKQRILIISIAILVISLLASFVHAKVPKMISYQGKLTDALGQPVKDSTYTVWFRIYPDATGNIWLWEEQQSVNVKDGLFSVILGNTMNFESRIDTIFNGSTRWLGIQVSPDPEMTPRKPIACVGYAFRALDADKAEYAIYADTANYSLSATADNDWIITGDNIYREQGNVGIGTMSPSVPLHIKGDDPDVFLDINSFSSDNWTELRFGVNGNSMSSVYWSKVDSNVYITNHSHGPAEKMVFDPNGNLGIGTDNPSAKLHVAGAIKCTPENSNHAILLNESSETGTPIDDAFRIRYNGNFFGTNTDALVIEKTDGNEANPDGGLAFVNTGNDGIEDVAMVIRGNGNVGIGKTSPQEKLDVDGVVKVNVSGDKFGLQVHSADDGNILVGYKGSQEIIKIGAGFDYSETFPTIQDEITPGMVMVIDPVNKGNLAISNHAYDSKVAGIVAGAKGLDSGMRLGAESTEGYAVALAGRVYCNVDTQYGEIEPGDLLTTSPTPGHAMVVKDFSKAQGTILGKAMEGLSSGKGQILVLVTLQ